jgi:flavin-dependent dehydrogenase
MHFDVVVIGGGPAGCAAAITLRQHGVSTAIVSTPLPHEKPTETAAPALRQLLETIGASNGLTACEPCFGIVSDWGRNDEVLRPSVTNPFGNAWFIHRKRFDAELQKAAISCGTHFISNKAEGIQVKGNGVTVVTNTTAICASWTVFATGSPAWTANCTGQIIQSEDSLTCFWARLSTPTTDRLLRIEAVEYGWWYFCPGTSDDSIACLVTDPSSARVLSPATPTGWNRLFQTTKFAQTCRATANNIHATWTGLKVLPKKYGDRWIAVGDAAASLDPLGSSGTISALEGGRKAAAAAAKALTGGFDELEKYARWSNGLVAEFGRQRQLQYQLEARRHQQFDGFWPRRIKPSNVHQLAA